MLSPFAEVTATIAGVVSGLVVCYYALIILVNYGNWASEIRQGRKNGKTGFGFFLKYALVKIIGAIWITILICLFLWIFHVALALLMKLLRGNDK